MSSKKKMALPTYPETKTVSVPIEKRTRLAHPLVKDLLWAKTDEDPIGAFFHHFEYVDSESTMVRLLYHIIHRRPSSEILKIRLG